MHQQILKAACSPASKQLGSETTASPQLLKTPQAGGLLDSLDPVTASYLTVYKTGAEPVQQSFERELADPQWSLERDGRLWSVGGQSYSAWVCNLAFALLIRAHNPMLRVCSHMVRMTGRIQKPEEANTLTIGSATWPLRC